MGWQAAVSSSCPIMPKKIRPLLRAKSATAAVERRIVMVGPRDLPTFEERLTLRESDG